MGKKFEQTIYKKRQINGQQTHEKCLSGKCKFNPECATTSHTVEWLIYL